MDVSASSWLVILLALVAANLPFVNDKVFALVALKSNAAGQARRKPFWVRLLELALLYLIVGGVGMALESRIGTIFQQTWEFYWIGAFVFLVLGFPGFVVRYLRKRH
jgi:hypothetical protein